MVAKASGNHGASHMGSSFAGSSGRQVPFGWVAVTGDAGDVFFLDAAKIPVKYGAANLGTFFQSEVPVDVSFTLCHPENACSEEDEMQAGVLWGSDLSILPSDIVGVLHGYTAIRIAFAGKGTVYIGVM